jgi:OmpA-OmpF porin, OOP family
MRLQAKNNSNVYLHILLAFVITLFLTNCAGSRDKDKDGIPDKLDECPNEAEDFDRFEDNDGCPDVDNDKDGICDPWVAEQGLSAKYAHICRGSDKCPDIPEDIDGFEDEDGCPDPDNDQDGIPDKFDKCPNEKEDFDGFEDTDGCPDVDNDKDGICDPWVAEQGLSAKYAHICTGIDKCPNEPEDIDGFEDEDGCPDLDNDGDGIPDVLDKCPNEPETFNGIDDDDGCPDADSPPVAERVTLDLRFETGLPNLTFEDKVKLETTFPVRLKAWPAHKIYVYLFMPKVEMELETYLELLNARTQNIANFLIEKGVSASQIKIRTITQEIYESQVGTENDFNSDKPALFLRK